VAIAEHPGAKSHGCNRATMANKAILGEEGSAGPARAGNATKK
jgi:hypothetical protein